MEQEGTFQNNLGWYIKHSGKTQKTLAKAFHISENMMTYYVRGRIAVPAEPGYNLREKFAEYFHVAQELIFPLLPPPENSSASIGQTARPATEHASFMVQSIERSPTADEASTKKLLVLPPMIIEGERAPLDCFTWYGRSVKDIQSIGAAGQPFSCQQIQAQTRAEIERMLMPHSHARDDAVRFSRRTALAALAMLSSTLLTKAQAGQWSTLDLEEFLTQCAQSLTACHYLMREDGLVTVASALPSYLPILSLLAEQKTPYRKQAADLATQGHLLSSWLALHRLQISERERECHQALHYSKISGNANLIVYSLENIAGSFLEKNPANPEKALYWLQKAEPYIARVSPLCKSKIMIELARSHAECGHIQEALRYMRLAQEAFPDYPEADELALLEKTSSLAMWEGNIYLDLGDLAVQQGQPHRAKVLYQASWETFSQLVDSPAKLTMPKRLYIETFNFSSKSAIALKDYERFEQTLLAGVQGAKELGSQKRYDEAYKNWQQAKIAWNKETKVMELAEVLIDSKPQQALS